ncbi:FlmD [Aliivibrio fischeri MJ11]|uniref:FlmD n=1 Tax=Aliivibrio fischeri (strain MJ11) TaxID=388396 RepID=B5FFV8_ALIFM|nr:UDP-2,4-diacetamido-2,4,6-trideoxy-beta-L-altropyranose hydrolase [Aliivibrio fischeri]ACH65069.1 FlmD [Aliivibrio fischeri MJ11]
MNIIIRTDASIHIGSGHVMRCLVLADALQEKAHKVSFVCRSQQGDMIKLIQERGFDVFSLDEIIPTVQPQSSADYLGWLQCPIEKDANDFLFKIKNADIVITDHYAIGKEWQSIVREQLSCQIVAIDDLEREHDADLILDQTLGRTKQSYPNIKCVLTGSEYALLNSNFATLREQAYGRLVPQKVIKVLVSMGGIDSPNATLAVLEQLVTLNNIEVTVLLSPRAPHYVNVSEFCHKKLNIKQIDFVSDMAKIMLEHDVAIGAPGTTSWERACLGLPSIIIPLAENQLSISKALVKAQSAIIVNLNDIENCLLDCFRLLVNDWYSYYQANLKLCDGLGLYRVLLEIDNLNEDSKHRYRLQNAIEYDTELIYQWQCHPQTRKYALNSEPPSWEAHIKWMHNKIACSNQDYFYLIQDTVTNKKVGVVRLDRLNVNEYLISIFISPDFYGKSIGISAVKLLDILHPKITIRATVLEDNKASQQLFKKAKYYKISADEFIRYPVK